jgi:maltooligosyltrehalose trehalohydrolase
MRTRLGATPLGEDRCRFLVWAPRAEQVELHLIWPEDRVVPMERRDKGYREATAADVPLGARYLFRLDGRDLPDPASSFQPEGVHGPSAVVDPNAFRWSDADWSGIPLSGYVIYELHVGTFTPEGTFQAAISHLDELAELGVTAIEVMPVAQFPGSRNWGYDGVFPHAVQDSYGGPSGLVRLVDECHRRGMAFVLDVVYNHIGPEGGVLAEYGPYFTDRYRTPWGEAINFDGPGSDEVRRFFVENAVRWSTDFHVDALRLDAVHGIVDTSAHPFLQELSEAAEGHTRPFTLIAESDQNDARLVTPREAGGLGIHAQWSDDFHHALHAAVTGERDGYYRDFGALGQVAKAYREGFVFSGQYSEFRGRRFGSSSAPIPGDKLVIYVQNHDQVGNRLGGDRLSSVLSFEQLKLLAGALLVAPYVPLLFMGEEYGELAPFQYFTSHTIPDLVESVRRGRREEFAAFGWGEDMPDPQRESTFEGSKLDHGLKEKDPHRLLLALYGELLRLRRRLRALRELRKDRTEIVGGDERSLLAVRRWSDDDEVLALFNFHEGSPTEVSGSSLGGVGGEWATLLNSADLQWGGPGPERPGKSQGDLVTVRPHAFVLLHRNRP